MTATHAGALSEPGPGIIDPDLVWPSDDGIVRLRATRCNACQHKTFPPLDHCTNCLSDDVSAFPLDGEATVYSFSVVHAAPANWTVPYALGYIDFPSGIRVLGHIQVPHDTLQIGLRVRLALGDVGTGETGPLKTYVFVEVDSNA